MNVEYLILAPLAELKFALAGLKGSKVLIISLNKDPVQATLGSMHLY